MINLLASRLRSSSSGVAMTELALGAPFLLMAGLWGIETANFALANMKVSQLALHIADNASRIGDSSTLMNRKIFEEDVNDLMIGANLQGGTSINLLEHGRVIVSSIEIWNQANHKANGYSGSEGTTYIAWQRCKGAKNVKSNYGPQNSALPNGIGPTGYQVNPEPDTPVIYVEITYDYQPLFSTRFIGPSQITAEASFVVRDYRDQWDIYKRNSGTPAADCQIFNSTP